VVNDIINMLVPFMCNSCKISNLYARVASLLRLKKANMRIGKAIRHGDVKLSFGPSSLNLMMIDKCNSECIMCGHDYKGSGSADALTMEKIKTIYRHLDMRQIVDVIYGGGGEPFLNPELAAIAEYTRRLCPTVQHTVISNLIFSNEEVYRRLLKSRVNFLVSVNAASPEVFKIISGVDVFDRVIANIRTLVSLRKEVKAMVGISLSIILMRQNVRELSDFVQLAHDLGVDGVKVVYVRIYPEEYRRKKDGNILIQPKDSLFYHQEESDKAMKDAEQIAKELEVSFEHQPLFNCLEEKERDCKEPWRSLFINFDGALFPCAASEIMFMHKVYYGQYNSGNILKQTIEEIWNNPFWRALRETNTLKNRVEIIPECLCCGMSIDWCGVKAKKSHIMDWRVAEESDLRI